MSASLVVHVVQRAAPVQSAWLVRLLEPVAAACRFDPVPPLEIRPTGRWGGWSSGASSAPDGRVAVSNKFVFWTAENVINVVIHEWTHRALQHEKVLSHGPEFFCLNAVLLLRSAQFFDDDCLHKLRLYDLQDCPEELADEPNWRGLVLGWALPLAAELAASLISAQQLAPVICSGWEKFVSELLTSKLAAEVVAEQARRAEKKRMEDFEELRSARFAWRVVSVVGWTSFFFLGWVVL